MKSNLCFTLLILMLLISACSVKRPVSSIAGATPLSKPQTKQFLTDLMESQLDYETFQGKAKTKIGLNNRSFNTTAVIRIKHNKAIWISFTSILSMEVARVMITPTQVRIINRINRTYIDQPYEFIHNYTSKNISFQELEYLITGAPLSFTFNPNNTVFTINDGYQLTGTQQSLAFEMLYNQDATLLSNTIQDSARNQHLKIEYGRFEVYESALIPRSIKIEVNSPDQMLTTSLDYTNIRIDDEISIPFSIPGIYKRIDTQ